MTRTKESTPLAPAPAIIGAVLREDGKRRPAWAATDVVLRAYYDTEWGMPVTDEQGMLEHVCLEEFLIGLSWRLILTKHAALRRAFCDFDPDSIARLTRADIDSFLNDPAPIRNERKRLDSWRRGSSQVWT